MIGKLIRTLPAITVMVAVTGCSAALPPTPPPPESTPSASPLGVAAIPGADVLDRGERRAGDVPVEDLRALAAARNEFALDIYRVLAGEQGNIALGPDSISNALTMTYAGARGNTSAEMRSAMHFSLPDDRLHGAAGALNASLLDAGVIDGVQILRGTRLFGQQGFDFEEPFLETLSRDYGAPLAAVDFGDSENARGVINAWVAQLTQKLIEELMPAGSIDSSTRLVIVDAQYLKAAWKEPFDPELTHDAPFHVTETTTLSVPTMTAHLDIPVAGDADWVAGELPYTGERLAMLVIVPQDLGQFESSLTSDRLDAIVGQLAEASRIPVLLPRFDVKLHTDLIPTMRSLGVNDLFGPADLSGIAADADLFVSAIEHEAVVKVNEEGTEAAAATGVGVAESAPLFELKADRPFLFFVRDRETGAILFMGRVADPLADG